MPILHRRQPIETMKRRAALEHGILQSKRAKPAQNLTQTLTIDKVAHEEKYQINFAQDLQKLLAFSQDADPQHLKQSKPLANFWLQRKD